MAKSILAIAVIVTETAYMQTHGRQALISADDFDWGTTDLNTLAEQCDKRVEISKQYAVECRDKINSLL